jgi:hypothetical protein
MCKRSFTSLELALGSLLWLSRELLTDFLEMDADQFCTGSDPKYGATKVDTIKTHL